jgi:hypothetical protein
MKSRNGFVCLIICLMMCCFYLSTGCTTSNIPEKSSPFPTALTTTVNESPVISTTISISPPTFVTINTPAINTPATHTPATHTPTLTVSTIATPVPLTTMLAGPSDPFVQAFSLNKYDYGISDCIMKQVFPDIALDPDYGIHSDHPKLVGLSNETWTAFYQDYTTGKNTGQSQTFSISKCENVPISDSTTWDFAMVYATLTPRNARPSEYSIIISINANNKDVAQLITTETLTLDQTIKISSWIPIKRTEIDALGTPQIYFNRLTNN